LFDSIKFSQLFQNSEGEKIPKLVEELKLFCLISLGGFCVAFISYLLKMFGKSFTGMTLIFILSVLVGVGTFLLMRLGLAQMISDGAAFGISWYFAYAAFAFLVIGYWYGKKAPSNITEELVD